MRANRFCWLWILILLIPWDFLLPNSHYALAKVIYVDKSATGDGSGTDWANACTTFTAGLTLSASGDQVWVKSATYYPEPIYIVKSVPLYGGFPSDGSPEFHDRDWVENKTVIGGVGFSSSCSGYIDGFTLRGGVGCGGGSHVVANCTIMHGHDDFRGYIESSWGSLMFTNCVVSENTAVYGASVVKMWDSTVMFVDCTISGNRSTEDPVFDFWRSSAVFRNCRMEGNSSTKSAVFRFEDCSAEFTDCALMENVAWGGLGTLRCANTNLSLERCTIGRGSGPAISCAGYGPVKLADCVISENGAGGYVGGLYSTAHLRLERCVIRDNLGTGIRSHGHTLTLEECLVTSNTGTGVYSSHSSMVSLSRCLVTGNSEGGVSVSYGSASCVNSTIAGNTSPNGVSGIYLPSAGSLSLVNSILWNPGGEIGGPPEEVDVRYSCIQGDWPGEGNIDANPLFVDPENRDWDLLNGSPCIDGGTDVGLEFNGSAPDIGAYESPEGYEPQPVQDPPRILRVAADASPEGDGSSWENALSSISSALEVVGTSGEIWLKSGRYHEAVLLEPTVGIYGGFDGTEEMKEDRDWLCGDTIIDATGFGLPAGTGSGNLVLDRLSLTSGTKGISITWASATVQDCTVSGNRRNDGYSGQGIDVLNSRVEVRRCAIAHNSDQGITCSNSEITIAGCAITENGGRGIYLPSSNGLISDCTLSRNGGGIAVYGSTEVRLVDCLITENSTRYLGGGAQFYDWASAELVNCVITRNHATQNGGAIETSADSVRLVHCTLADNSSDGECGGIFRSYGDPVSLTNSILWNAGSQISLEEPQRVAASHCCIRYGWPGEGNIDGDPLFVDPEGGDYRLRNGSPCLDRGVASGLVREDYLGNPRPGDDGLVDIGAFEMPGEYEPAAAKVVYVDAAAEAGGDGLSWESALGSIGEALDVAASSDEIWVASGTYREAIRLRAGLDVYGGFLPGAVALDERDWPANPTIIDASGLNTHTVVAPHGTCVLDGFTITGGSAHTKEALRGGGVYCESSSPLVRNCVITGNTTSNGGGGLFASGSLASPSLVNCIISENVASAGGGVVAVEGASVTLLNTVIARNIARWGRGSGLLLDYGAGSEIVHCTIADNGSGMDQSGIYAGEGCPLRIVSSILWNLGAEIEGDPDDVAVIFCCVEEGWPGLGNFNDNPVFVSAENGDYHLQDGSRCIDAGLVDGAPPTDLEGNPRPGGDGKVDVGAYESADQYEPVPPKVIHVRSDALPGGDGTSWDSALNSIQAALDVALTADQVWVASGAYREAIGFNVGVGLYGGFPLYGSTGFEDRDWETNRTIIDATGFTTHCIFGRIGAATIDGLTITGGSAEKGGGVYWERFPLALRNCTISRNSTTGDGGGVYLAGIADGTAEIRNCVVTGNRAGRYGGGFWFSGVSSVQLVQCRILRNTAESRGGGVHHWLGNLVLEGCEVVNNQCGSYGGGIAKLRGVLVAADCRIEGNKCARGGGGVYSSGDCLFTKCFIVQNSAGELGGAAHFAAAGDPSFLNCTIADNTAAGGAGVLNDGGLVDLRNCVIWNVGSELRLGAGAGEFSVEYSCVRGGWPGDGNIADWPFFVDRASGDYRLQNGSPCINAGKDLGLPFSGAAPDMGAWESPADYSPGGLIYVPTVVYVAWDAPPGGDGTSWDRAFATITQALMVPEPYSEIWAKGGSYQEAIEIPAAVSVYGGFAGNEDELTQRNWLAHPTVIDATGLSRSAVVAADGSILDGFTVSGGSADVGGGVYCLDHAFPTIRNCAIIGNYAQYEGGGLFSRYGSPTVTGCSIVDNTARYMGGGVSLRETSFATITKCTFDGNRADAGGGIALVGRVSPILDSCTFAGNRADSYGGGIHSFAQSSPNILRCMLSDNTAGWVGGGLMVDDEASPTLHNCLIVGNAADSRGGGVACYWSSPELTNCAITGNSAPSGGNLFVGWNRLASLTNCIVRPRAFTTHKGGSIQVSWSNVEGGWPGEGNIDEPPAFVYPWDGHWGDLHLLPTSPCIDAGNPDPAFNDACRPPGLGSERNDMGAYGGPDNCEGPPPLPTPESGWTPQPTPTGTSTPTVTQTPTATETPTPTPTPLPGDTNHDGVLDRNDVFFFSHWWQEPINETNFRCDPTHDSMIDQNDLLWLIEKWRAPPPAP